MIKSRKCTGWMDKEAEPTRRTEGSVTGGSSIE